MNVMPGSWLMASVCIDLHGGYGFTKEYPVEKLMADVKIMQIHEGTNRIQREIIAMSLINLNGSPTQVVKIFTPPKPGGGTKSSMSFCSNGTLV